MTKRFLALLVMLCIAIPTMAQSVKITAKIVDAESKEGIIGAIMEVVDPKSDKRRHSVSGAAGATIVTGVTSGE
ncbi:MAG: hypothetical protein J6R02_05255, partial [Alistipes sp.]|nr:hypothetical protein [Alistipes sp.]